MEKDTFSPSTARPTAANGTSVKTVSCAANAWCEINTTDAAWLAALVDETTTCFYINRYASGYGNGFTDYWDTGSYWEGNGADGYDGDGLTPELYIDWIPRTPQISTPNITAIPNNKITTDSYTFDFSDSIDSTGDIAPENIWYVGNLSLDNGETWGPDFTTEPGVSQVEVNLREYLNLENGQYHIEPNVRFKVQAFGTYEGETYHSDTAISNLFQIDYRITPSAPTNLTISNPTPYEGETVTFTAYRPESYNLLDADGETMALDYFVRLNNDLLVAYAVSDVTQDSAVTSAWTVDSYANFDDLPMQAKVIAKYEAEGDYLESPPYQWCNFTIKQFRKPKVIITDFNRSRGGNVFVYVTVTDTGYGADGQTSDKIRKLLYTLDGITWVDDIHPTWDGLNGVFPITGLDDGLSYPHFAVKVVNKYPIESLSDKESNPHARAMPTYLPIAHFWRDTAAEGDKANAGMSIQAINVSRNYSEDVNDGCIKVEKDIDAGGAIRVNGQEVLTVESMPELNYLPLNGGTITGQLNLEDKLVLDSDTYGTSLPPAGTPGRIFFLKV